MLHTLLAMAKSKTAKKASEKTKVEPSKAGNKASAPIEEDAAPDGAAKAGDVPAELRQLGEIRRGLAALTPALAAKLLAQHSDDDCKEKGSSTKATDVFRAGMSWARTIGEQIGKPGFPTHLCRWFLDCLTVLGQHVMGAPTTKNPSDEASYLDVTSKADKLLVRTRSLLKSAAGNNETHKAELAKAFDNKDALDERVANLKGAIGLVKYWLGAKGGPPLEAYEITEDTLKELQAAAKELDGAIARKPAAQQSNRDTPGVNISEGRVLFVMRTLWDRLAEAREDNKTNVTLTVNPAILRGLDLVKRKKKLL